MRLEELPRQTGAPRREFPPSPIVGIGAVVLDGDRVLLVRRGREPLKGEWSLPGGALELGETLEAGVCREIAEETGIEVKTIALAEVLDKIVADEDRGAGGETGDPAQVGAERGRIRYHYVLIDFVCVAIGGELRAGTDAEDARWVSREELNSHGMYRLAPATAAVVEKAFGLAQRLSQERGGPVP